MVSILCLMMILHGGFANPVADEGVLDSGLDLLSWILPEPLQLVTSEEVYGDLGDGRIFSPNDMKNVNLTSASASDECCSKCQALIPDARFYVFSRNIHQCACLTPTDGVKPATMDPGPLLKDWMPSPVAGVCAEKLWRDDGRCGKSYPLPSSKPGQCDPTANANAKGPCCSIIGWCGNTDSHCYADSDKEHVAEALQIPASNTSPIRVSSPVTVSEVCDGSFVCCPHLTDGDNTLGTERFIQESEYKDSFSSCTEACQVLQPFSNGVTQSKTQTYGSNGKPLCWCEFGEAKYNTGEGYQTCLFKIQEDDYDY